MASVVTVLVFVGIGISIVAYALCISSSGSDDKILVIHNRQVIEKYSNNISRILDKLQLLLSECPMHVSYIMEMYDVIIALNNKYICNKIFDISLLNKLMDLWSENGDKAEDQLLNFDDIDAEFKSLRGIMNSVTRQLSDE